MPSTLDYIEQKVCNVPPFFWNMRFPCTHPPCAH